jgi:hypothetical protein
VDLQRRVGNRAVARLIRSTRAGDRRVPTGRILARDLSSVLDSLEHHPGQIVAGLADPTAAAAALANATPAWDRAAGVVEYGVHRGPQNAMRHCLWSAFTFRDLTRDLRAYYGVVETTRPEDLPPDFPTSGLAMVDRIQQRAEDAVMIHERSGGGELDPADSALDQFNNRVGFRIVRVLKGRGQSADQISNDRIVNLAVAYLNEGHLRMSDPATGAPIPTSNWRRFVRSPTTDPWGHVLPQPAHPSPDPDP